MASKKYSRKWKQSKQPRKQRKYRYNAPLHVRQNFMHSHLSKELREKYNRRSFRVAKGDTVIVMRGTYKGYKGKVERVDLKKLKVYIAGLTLKKKDGSTVPISIDPSNIMIIELNLEDKKRRERLEKNIKVEG
ncbi:50S ribosomal protein L24 [Candidatus Woesearchaeota archaeon]|nr:50S ribosomal protein L24 [Candidatus Woesearchaeota archaeon]